MSGQSREMAVTIGQLQGQEDELSAQSFSTLLQYPPCCQGTAVAMDACLLRVLGGEGFINGTALVFPSSLDSSARDDTSSPSVHRSVRPPRLHAAGPTLFASLTTPIRTSSLPR